MTVQGLGWAGVTNGELLRRAAGQVDAFLTMDRRLEHEHDLGALSFGVVVIRARSNRMQDLGPLIGPLTAALTRMIEGHEDAIVFVFTFFDEMRRVAPSSGRH